MKLSILLVRKDWHIIVHSLMEFLCNEGYSSNDEYFDRHIWKLLHFEISLSNNLDYDDDILPLSKYHMQIHISVLCSPIIRADSYFYLYFSKYLLKFIKVTYDNEAILVDSLQIKID